MWMDTTGKDKDLITSTPSSTRILPEGSRSTFSFSPSPYLAHGWTMWTQISLPVTWCSGRSLHALPLHYLFGSRTNHMFTDLAASHLVQIRSLSVLSLHYLGILPPWQPSWIHMERGLPSETLGTWHSSRSITVLPLPLWILQPGWSGYVHGYLNKHLLWIFLWVLFKADYVTDLISNTNVCMFGEYSARVGFIGIRSILHIVNRFFHVNTEWVTGYRVMRNSTTKHILWYHEVF